MHAGNVGKDAAYRTNTGKPMMNNNAKPQSTNGENLRPVAWDTIKLTPFRKNFYQPSPGVSNQSPVDIEEFLSTHQITLKGNELPAPCMEFHDGVFPPYVMEEIQKQGFEKPTSIQAQAWPIALSGRDLVGTYRSILL